MQEDKVCLVTHKSHCVKITLKTTQNIKKLLKQAAKEAGLSLNAYIVNHAVERANNVLVNKQVTELKDQAWASLKRAIENPEPASETLKKLTTP